MLADGLFERFPCRAVFGLHNWPGLPAGLLATRPGPMMASSNSFDIRLDGKGSHAAMPHMAIDPIVLGAQVVMAFQAVVSRNTKALSPAVVSVTRFKRRQRLQRGAGPGLFGRHRAHLRHPDPGSGAGAHGPGAGRAVRGQRRGPRLHLQAGLSAPGEFRPRDGPWPWRSCAGWPRPRAWTRTWSPPWPPRISRTCLGRSRGAWSFSARARANTAWPGTALGRASCTTPATTSTTNCCPWAWPTGWAGRTLPGGEVLAVAGRS